MRSENKNLPIVRRKDKGFVRTGLHSLSYTTGLLWGSMAWAANKVMPEDWYADVEEAESTKEAFRKGRERVEEALDDLLEGII